MLKNDYLVAKIGFDTAENEPYTICQTLQKLSVQRRRALWPPTQPRRPRSPFCRFSRRRTVKKSVCHILLEESKL